MLVLQQLALPAIPLLLDQPTDTVETNAGGIHGSGTTPIQGFTAVGYGNAYNGSSGGNYNTLVGYGNAGAGINAGGNTIVGAHNANQTAITGTNNNIIGAYCINNNNTLLSGTQKLLFGYLLLKLE